MQPTQLENFAKKYLKSKVFQNRTLMEFDLVQLDLLDDSPYLAR